MKNMKNKKRVWIIGSLVTIAIIVIPLMIFLPANAEGEKDPWENVPEHVTYTDHSAIIQGPFETPQEITAACLDCHPDAADQVMHTTHWTWESDPFQVEGRDEAVTIGKFNQINNFCISTAGNESKCMTCHIGYGWEKYPPKEFDFAAQENIDCLACHADMDTYAKGGYGNPADGVDLVAAAQSVSGPPTRDNCGKCHFDGGGGNGVKHGDLDESLYFPGEDLDVHMGRYDFLCIDCHQTSDHQIKGRLVADNYQIPPEEQVACTDCHDIQPHDDERVNSHTDTLACQTCHVPALALKDPTKTFWDWSKSGNDDVPEDHFTYLKIKGSFTYDTNVLPSYEWYNGDLDYRYILGDKIDPTQPTMINDPAGNIDDPNAKIFPFKIHVAIQPYDSGYNTLLAPITAGEGGYWHDFVWDTAFQLAEERIGIPYSGEYDFTETWMYWPSTHMVQPKESALSCDDCHGEDGRMDWEALGYPGDPIEWGGR